MSIARWKQKLVRFGQLDGPDKWLLLRAAGALAVARLRLLVIPFDRLAAGLSVETDPHQAEYDPELLRRISYAVAIAANHVPWRSDCFPQAIAAHQMLQNRGHASTIYIGVERVGDDALAGHAWLTCGETVVTGGEELDRYAEMHRLGG